MPGKFSQPRPHRDEERQIEETFRKVTGEHPRRAPMKAEYTPQPLQKPEDQPEIIPQPAAQETFFLPVEELPKAQEEKAPETAAKARRLAENMTAFLNDVPDFEEAPPEPREPDLVDKLMDSWQKILDYAGKNRKVVLITLCALAVVMICGFIGVLFGSFSDPYDRKILDNVTIVDVQVGGMTKKEATNAVKKVADNLFAQPMVVDLSGSQITLSPKDAKVNFDVKAAVEAAYAYGRSGTNAENQQAYILSKTTPYAVPLTERILTVDDIYIRTALSAYAEGSGATLTQTDYGLDGMRPQLTADKFDKDAPGQTLVITMGTPGVGFDVADVTRQVVASYRQRLFLVVVENVEVTKDPDPIDLRAVWEEFTIDPVNAAIDPDTKQPIPGSYGYTFDLEQAQKLVDEAEFGQEVRIPMEYVEPDILDASAFYKDVLGEHQTRHTNKDKRNTNLRIACEAINGTVVEPGATFSFNETTGKRNSAKGYEYAFSDAEDYAEEVRAGGVSQVASTLYYAALVADMNITARTAGKYAPSFIEFGMDAEVDSSTDFSFRNPHTYPVRIDAQVTGGYVKVQILGTEEREHYVMLEQSVTKTIKPETEYEDFTEVNPDGWLDGDEVRKGITGYTVQSYKVKLDRQTNSQLSRDAIATSSYKSEKRIVAKIEVPETTAPTVPTTVPPTTVPPTVPPTTAPTVPSTEAPTQPPTQAPTQAPTVPPETQALTEPPTVPPAPQDEAA